MDQADSAEQVAAALKTSLEKVTRATRRLQPRQLLQCQAVSLVAGISKSGGRLAAMHRGATLGRVYGNDTRCTPSAPLREGSAAGMRAAVDAFCQQHR